MTERALLPPQLDATFAVREARELGVNRSRLRARDLKSPFHGLRSLSAASPDAGTKSGVHDIRALMRVLPRYAFICGATAAMLYGIPLPLYVRERAGVDVGVPRGCPAVRRKGVRGRVFSIPPACGAELEGIRVLPPAVVWVSLACELDLASLVAAGDFLIHRERRIARIDELRDAVDGRAHSRGVRRLREAIELLDDAAESPMESVLRTHLVCAGLPKPVCNQPIFDETGRFIARPDLTFVEARVIVEYQGDYHRTVRDQWRRDISRRAELESLGYVVVEVTGRDLQLRDQLITRIRRHLSSRPSFD